MLGVLQTSDIANNSANNSASITHKIVGALVLLNILAIDIKSVVAS